MGIDQVDATMYIVDKIRKLIIEDEEISDKTKKVFLEYYMQYKLHHKILEGNVKDLVDIASK